MTKIQRIRSILVGMVMLVCTAVLVLFPEFGYSFIAAVLSLSLVAYGVRLLVYYSSMARHMVGGRGLLYLGVIVLDLGVFTAVIANIPQLHIMVYLLAVHLATGAISVARGVEAKRADAPLWKYSMSSGIANLLLAVACLAFIWAPSAVIYIYAAGLAYTACLRIASAFRPTAVVYIP